MQLGPLTAEQAHILRAAFSATVEECQTSAVGNLLENHLKVVIVDRLLRLGCAIMEGTSRAGRGKIVRVRDGRIGFEYVARPSMPTSPDIRVVAPVQLVLELQARSLFGTQDTLFSANIADDLDRVRDGRAHAFILAADLEIYDPIRGLKATTRGRKALLPEVLAAALPPSSGCECGTSLVSHGPSGEFACMLARVMSPFQTERLIVALSRAR